MSAQNIQVAVRCRPLNEREKKSNGCSVIECNERRREVVAIDRNSSISSTKTFTYDKVFGMESKQIDVYNQVVRPVVKEVLEGYNCTIFAYGQTGTGKTFTMEGDCSQLSDYGWEEEPNVGIIPRSVSHLFTLLSSMPHCEYSVKISYMELYNEELTDLLSDSTLEKDEKLKIYDDPGRKGSVIVSKLEEKIVQNKNQVFKILQKGADRRQKASTLMNNQSSRSHSIFTVTVFIKDRAIEGEEIIKVGKLNLVDLAGSENIERSGATGKRAAEAGKINKSLTTLGRVITALVQHSDHIPYRESNLTRLLQDSLGGRTKTTIIATISPALCNLEETLSTLDYAHKAKSIRNKPEINQKLVKKQLIKEYNEEIERLKRELNATREKNGVYLPSEIYQEMETNTKMLKLELREYIKKFSANSEQLDIKNEELKKLSEELEEKNENLFETQTMLSKTNNQVAALEQQIKELKYLVGERTASEEKLSNQAKKLIHYSSELEADNAQLFCKIDRFEQLEKKNRNLVDKFANFVNQNVSTLNAKEHEIVTISKQKNCSLCELLKEIQMQTNENNEETGQQLEWLGKKVKAWTDSQLYFVEKELESALKENFDILKNSIDGQHSNFAQTCENVMNICHEHKDSFANIFSKLNGSIDEFANNFANFESNFLNSINNFLAEHFKESNEWNLKIVLGLVDLSESSELNQNEVNEMLNYKRALKNEINESINVIQDLLVKTSRNLNSKLDRLDSHYDQLIINSENHRKKLNQIIDLIKENEHKKNKKFSSELERQISAPIKHLTENSSKNLIELSILAKSVNEKIEVFNQHFTNSVQGIKMADEENHKETATIVNSQYEKFEKICKKIQSNYKDNEANINKQLEKLQQEIKEFSNLTAHKIDEGLNYSQDLKQNSETLAEINRDLCFKITREAIQFNDQDYEDYGPTGRSPKKKEINKIEEIPNPKTNDELLDILKSSNNDYTKSGFLTYSNSSSKNSFMSMESTRPSKIESQQGFKRGISDKENTLDTEKASKVKRLASSSRITNKNTWD